MSNSVRKSLRSFGEVLATCPSRIFIEFSMSPFVCIVFLFFDFLWLIDASLVFIFIISHNSPGVTVLSNLRVFIFSSSYSCSNLVYIFIVS